MERVTAMDKQVVFPLGAEIRKMEPAEIKRQTADLVEVVRCRDCRWWHDWNGECYAKEAQGFGHLWEADDYCSYGERKDGGND